MENRRRSWVGRRVLAMMVMLIVSSGPGVVPALADAALPLALRAALVSEGMSELRTRDRAGAAVASDGLVAVVGGPEHDLAGNDTGALFVYRFEDGMWRGEGRLMASDLATGAHLGAAVAVSGDVIVAGAPAASGPAGELQGTVVVFEYDGSSWAESGRLTAPGAAAGDAFGTAVALTGDRLVIGAPRADGSGVQDSGLAYVFERAGDEFVFQTELAPSPAVASGRFGSAVAATGERVAVGEPRANAAATAAGAVTVFLATGGWSEEQRLSSADGAPGDAFGSSLASSGDHLVVGAPESGGTGAAYIFERTGGGWQEQARVTPAAAAADDGYGHAVALNGDWLAVGGPDAGSGGRVVVFDGGGSSWQEVATVQPASGGSDSEFGSSLAAAFETLLVGAPGDGQQGTDAGTAWAFAGSGADWDGGTRLQAAGTAAFDLFGVTVALDGDTAVVGAPAEDVGTLEKAGAAYVFVREAGTWLRQARLVAANPTAGSQFGTDVDVSGDLIAVGAWLENAVAADSGAVHVFERSGGSWSEVERLAPSGLVKDDYFGRAVSLDGDTVAATAAGGSTVYVHVRESGSWVLQDTLQAFPRSAYPLLLSSVAVDGDILVVGSRTEEAAFVFERSGALWAETARLNAPSGQNESFFGQPVAVHDGLVAVAAPLENVGNQLDAGAVYLYVPQGGSWALEQRLESPQPGVEDAFGVGLDLCQGQLAVGAPFNRVAGPGAGYAVLFARDGGSWVAREQIPDPTGQAGAQFGASLACAGKALLSGAWSTDRPPGTPDQGAAYLYEPTPVATEAPVARLSFLPTAPVAGEAVQLVDVSANLPTSWTWDLGDGRVSYDPNPVHIYPEAGSYVVRLTVANAFGQDSTQATVVVRESGDPGFQPDTTIAAVARVEGAGAFFSSRLELFNAGAEDLLLQAVYTPRVDVGGPARATSVELAAGAMLEVDDPLAEWFGLAADESGVGSLMLEVVNGDPGALLTYSVVFARNPDGSEYGQLFPAVAGDGGAASGTAALLATTPDPAHNRVNAGAMALADGTRVRLSPADPLGHQLAAPRIFELDLGQSQQLNNLHQVFGLAPTTADFLLVAEVLSGRASVYGSVVDGVGGSYPGTNDPTTILPLQGAGRVTLLALGPVTGFNEFSGSASVCNLDPAPTSVTASFYARDDGAGGAAASTVLELAGGDTVGFPNLVGELFATEGVGTVVLEAPPGATIAATGREFSLQKDAAGELSGQAGQLIRGLRDEEMLRPGTTYHLLGLRQIEASPVPERSNFLAFNPGSSQVSVTLRLFDGASGSFEGEASYAVAAEEMRQVNLVIGKINPAQDGRVKRLEVEVDGPLFVQAVRANRDGDPITIDPLAPLQ